MTSQHVHAGSRRRNPLHHSQKSSPLTPDLLIGSQTGTTNFYTAVYEVLDGDEANPRIKLFENFGAAVQALLAGDVDMVLMDAASSRGYIGANPDKLKIVGDPLGTEEFGFIFTPGSDLVEPFNAAIAQMKADGYLEYLNTRWFFLTDPNAEDVYDKLPILDGRTVVAVTGNDYTPLNFVDPPAANPSAGNTTPSTKSAAASTASSTGRSLPGTP